MKGRGHDGQEGQGEYCLPEIRSDSPMSGVATGNCLENLSWAGYIFGLVLLLQSFDACLCES